MRWNELNEDPCPVARGLSVLGDRWTLLILRDCFLGIRRFDQFQRNLGITRHLLSGRLRKLESEGLLRREIYQKRPLRHEYRLTDAGKDLLPILIALIGWTERHHPSETPSPFRLVSRQTGAPLDPLLIDGASGTPITHRTISLKVLDPDSPLAQLVKGGKD